MTELPAWEKLHSPFLSEKHGNSLYISETLFDYFVRTKYNCHEQAFVCIYNRDAFLKALNSSERFLDFWNVVQEQYPSRRDYFLSLTKKDELYNPDWIEFEYDEYMERKAFESLSEEERRTLQEEFDESIATVYQAALEGESRRLSCDIDDVIKTSLVLPCELDHNNESMLTRLPNQLLFGKIFPLLETLDVLNMTLVCKRWKRLIDDNAKELKRAEHSATAHLIRFTDWMHPPEVLHGHTLSYQHAMFAWCLARWYCGVAESLETLILDHAVSYTKLADLLQSCPNLKHLRVGYDLDLDDIPQDRILAQVKLRKLETFMSSPGVPYQYSELPSRQLYRDILISSQSLRAFKGALISHNLVATMVGQNPMSNVFSKIIALDLEFFRVATLEILAQIDPLQLRYLRLHRPISSGRVGGFSVEERSTSALNQLLPKLTKLEMLRLSGGIGVTNKTIQLMTDLKMNINRAVLYHAYFPAVYIPGKGSTRPMELDPLQPEVLDEFRAMLLSRNPDIELSNISFVLRMGETFEALEAMNTGFIILNKEESDYLDIPIEELYDPKTKRHLGID